MTDTLALEMAIRKKGLTKKAVSKHLNLTQQGFLLKLNNVNEFKASEIHRLCNLLDIGSNIFFVTEREYNSTNKGVNQKNE